LTIDRTDASRPLARRLAALPDFSWRGDAAVPRFPDDRPLIVFDGVCVLCSGVARFVARRDKQHRFHFTAAQSPLGQALYAHAGLDQQQFESNLLVADGRILAKRDAFVGVMTRLGPPWHLAAAARAVPAPIADWIYDRVARNRYRLFGRRDVCVVPDADWRERVIG
jgi:predicted DCC family thiol-disulfide oxidoreductase YuxK